MGANHCGTAAQKQDWEKQETYFFFPPEIVTTFETFSTLQKLDAN